jgi:glutamate racemase
MKDKNKNLITIGIFDSGLGGLSVVKALSLQVQGTAFIYFGDTARFPYGTKSAETITKYSIENTKFLIDQGAKIIVVACNTATSVALPSLSSIFSIPIFGVIDSAAKKAASVTKNGRIGVIGTTRTIKTQSYKTAIQKLLPNASVTSVACPLLVSMIEEGCPSKEAERLVVQEYLRSIKKQNVDTLLLGCTHYPHMRDLLQEEMGDTVTIVDPAESVSEAVSAALPSQQIDKKNSFTFFASDDTSRFKKVGEAFLGMKMGPVKIV